MKKKTSRSVATVASGILRNPKAYKDVIKLAGSALSQVNKMRSTGKKIESIASNVLRSKKYGTGSNAKKIAASLVSQSNKTKKR